LALILILGISFGEGEPGRVVVVVAAVLLLAVGIDYIVRSWADRIRRPSVSDEATPVGEIDTKAVERLVHSDGTGALDASTALMFARALIAPKLVFARLSEQVMLYHRSIKVTVNYTLTLEPGKADSDTDYVVPLFSSTKGEILDGLKVTNGDGKRVSTLDSTNSAIFCAAVIRSVIRTAGALSTYAGSDLEARIWKAIVSADRPDDDVIKELLGEVRALSRDPKKKDVLEVAARIVEQVAPKNLVSVLIAREDVTKKAWPHAHRFGLERRLIAPIDAPQGATPIQIALDDVRLALGIPLNRVFYDAASAIKARSYHLVIEGPEGTYLAANEILQTDEGKATFSAQIKPREGQRRGHIYITGAKGTGTIDVAANFFERAPGSFVGSTLSAAAATFVIFLLSITEPVRLASQSQAVQTWLLPALLAIPLAVSTLAGFESLRTPRHPSLLARGLGFTTIALCLAAFALASLGSILTDLALCGWKVLPLIGVAVTLCSFASWMMRIVLQNYFIRGRDLVEGT
jgi:hypothetical protein